MVTFAELGLNKPILAALAEVGYEQPSPIQQQAIKPLLAGKDMIGQAQTGSGKTAAFGLPLLQHVNREQREVQALVLTPTRELCIQVTQALRTYGSHKGIDVMAAFGGSPIRAQQDKLRRGAQVVVGTVGRVCDLISRHALILHGCRFVVLDEADEMLDLGFLEGVEKILEQLPAGRQTALFSATMPKAIQRLSERFLCDPEHIKVETKTLTVDSVEQFALKVDGQKKVDALLRVLESEKPGQAIIFVRTKIRCNDLHKKLKRAGFNAKTLHGDMSQGARDGVMIVFKEGRVAVLVATDVASRGLDVNGVTHVVNYDIPASPDVYVHRIGRTGRVGRSGRAITLYEPRQQKELGAIERHAKTRMSPWVQGAHVAPASAEAPPQRHNKPGISRQSEGPYAKVLINGGRAAGLEVADIVQAITGQAKVNGEGVRNVQLLEHFAVVEVPAGQANKIIKAVHGTVVRGNKLHLERLVG